MKRKILNIMLTVFMSVTAFCVQTNATEVNTEVEVQEMITYAGTAMDAAADEEIELIDAGYCGNSSVMWGVTTDGILIITGNGTMPDYEKEWYSTPWFEYNDYIYAVVVDGTVKNIGAYAFYYLNDLEVALIAKGVKTIGTGAFYECSKLEGVVIEDGLTKIGAEAFQLCIKLKYVEIPNTVTTIGRSAFSSCLALPEIKLPSKITTIEQGTFSGCDSLKSITIPNGVTKIGSGAFSGCESLTSISLPKSLTRIGDGAFMDCISLTTFTFPNTVKVIEAETFKGCKKLKTIQIPSGVTEVRRAAFYQCIALEKISLPDTVTELKDSAFYGCKNLREADLSDNITEIWKNAFVGCTKLTKLSLPEHLEKIDYAAFKDCDSLTIIRLPSSLKTIGERAFANCDNLTTVRIPASVTVMETYAFEDCNKLHKVSILNPDLKIYYDTFRNDNNLFIRCLENSSAHQYALNSNRPYELIDLSLVEEYFDDVYTDWYTDYVQYVYDNKLMTGMKGVTKFKPNANITKAQVAQVLYNMAGQPEVTDETVFTELKDVYANEWYADAVAWAYNEEIVTGDTNAKKFYPNADVTREQLALMMYRYAVYEEMDVTATSDLVGLQHAENVSNWATDGVKWAVGSGLISGIDKGDVKDLAPQGNATRAQMATILQRFCESNSPII